MGKRQYREFERGIPVCRYRIQVPAMEQGRQNAAYIYCMEDETEGYFWYDVEKWDTVAEVEMK